MSLYHNVKGPLLPISVLDIPWYHDDILNVSGGSKGRYCLTFGAANDDYVEFATTFGFPRILIKWKSTNSQQKTPPGRSWSNGVLPIWRRHRPHISCNPGPLLLTHYSKTSFLIMIWVKNYMQTVVVITHPCLTVVRLKLGHGWVMASHTKIIDVITCP